MLRENGSFRSSEKDEFITRICRLSCTGQRSNTGKEMPSILCNHLLLMAMVDLEILRTMSQRKVRCRMKSPRDGIRLDVAWSVGANNSSSYKPFGSSHHHNKPLAQMDSSTKNELPIRTELISEIQLAACQMLNRRRTKSHSQTQL